MGDIRPLCDSIFLSRVGRLKTVSPHLPKQKHERKSVLFVDVCSCNLLLYHSIKRNRNCKWELRSQNSELKNLKVELGNPLTNPHRSNAHFGLGLLFGRFCICCLNLLDISLHLFKKSFAGLSADTKPHLMP